MFMIKPASGCIILALLIGFLLVGCNTAALDDNTPQFDMQTQSVTNSVAVVAGDTIVFERLEFGKIPDLVPVTVTPASGRIHITDGTYLAGNPKLVVESSVEQNEDAVEIHINSYLPKDAGAVPAHPLGYLYEGQITGLPPGTYRLRLVHVCDFLRATQCDPVTVFDDSVTVR